MVFLAAMVGGVVALRFIPTTQYYETEEGIRYINENWLPVTIGVVVAMASATLYFLVQLLKYALSRARANQPAVNSGEDKS